jgi:hypothetical protein
MGDTAPGSRPPLEVVPLAVLADPEAPPGRLLDALAALLLQRALSRTADPDGALRAADLRRERECACDTAVRTELETEEGH